MLAMGTTLARHEYGNCTVAWVGVERMNCPMPRFLCKTLWPNLYVKLSLIANTGILAFCHSRQHLVGVCDVLGCGIAERLPDPVIRHRGIFVDEFHPVPCQAGEVPGLLMNRSEVREDWVRSATQHRNSHVQD
jgi:hypothetical protein